MTRTFFALSLLLLAACSHSANRTTASEEPAAAVGGPGVSKVEKRAFFCESTNYRTEVTLVAETDEAGELKLLSASAGLEGRTRKGQNKLGTKKKISHDFELEYENGAHSSFFAAKGDTSKNDLTIFDDVHESFEVMVKINGKSVSFKGEEQALCLNQDKSANDLPFFHFW